MRSSDVKASKHSLLTSILAGVFCLPAAGAVSLRDAYQAAVEKTETVAVAQSQTAQAEERITGGLGRIYPNISLQGTYQRQAPSGGAGATSAFTQADQYNGRVNLTQPLFHGLGEWAELSSRKALHRAQRAQEEQTKLTLYGTVADAYLAVLAAEKDQEDLLLQAKLTDQRIDELKGRVRIGRSRRGEQLSSEALAATLLAQLEGGKSSLAQARETLKNVTGLDAASTLVAEGIPAPPLPLPAVETFLADIEKRPDLVAAKALTESTSEQISVARAGHLPGLDFTANYWLFRTGILRDSHWDIGFQFTFPLFQGGSVQAAVREAAEKNKETELALAKLRREAEREIRSFHAALGGATSQFKALERALKLAETNYEEQKRDYRYGLVTNLDVLQALNAFLDTKRTYDKVSFQTFAAWAHLEASTGRLP